MLNPLQTITVGHTYMHTQSPEGGTSFLAELGKGGAALPWSVLKEGLRISSGTWCTMFAHQTQFDGDIFGLAALCLSLWPYIIENPEM